MTDDLAGDRIRVGVIGYGSILAPTEIDLVLTACEDRVVPVKVDGFKRVFNQEASWRDVDGPERGVLNVVRDDDHWFNGVLLADLDREEFERYRERERGYRLIEVEREAIDPYDTGDGLILTELELVLIATGKKPRDAIEPIGEYLDLCLEGAETWGREFEEDFRTTTEMVTGETLRRYLQQP